MDGSSFPLELYDQLQWEGAAAFVPAENPSSQGCAHTSEFLWHIKVGGVLQKPSVNMESRQSGNMRSRRQFSSQAMVALMGTWSRVAPCALRPPRGWH